MCFHIKRQITVESSKGVVLSLLLYHHIQDIAADKIIYHHKNVVTKPDGLMIFFFLSRDISCEKEDYTFVWF